MRYRLRHDRLLELIGASGLSQNHWAIKLGLSRGHWSGIVNGKHPYPSGKTRDRLVDVFGVSFEELFEVEVGRPTPEDQDFKRAVADRYVVDEEIGQGGMGTVYLARDVKLGRSVAIKVVSPEAVSGIGSGQFLKEIRYTARLQHPHILPVYDAGEVAGFPYYVTPFIRGGSLRQRLARHRRLSIDETLRIASGVAAALDHAHAERVLHCDIKPENVLLDGTHAYVADFGISRALHAEAFEWGRRREIDSSAGTPAYVSPEQASGERNLDARSDVYSFGCMVFEMLAGRPPFSGTRTMEIVAKRFTTEVPDLRAAAPGVPGPVAAAVTRAMELPPQRRPDTAKALVRQLEVGAARRRSNVAQTLARLGVEVALAGRKLLGRPLRSHRGGFMESVAQDVRQAVRSLWRRPGFTSVAVFTLALGIGANTAIFSVVNGVLLRPLPYDEPGRLMRVADMFGGRPSFSSMSPGNYLRLRAEATQFEDLVAVTGESFNVAGGDEPVRIAGARVVAGYFGLARTTPQLGRFFLPEDDTEGAAPVVVLSDRLWRDRFGADPAAVGRTISLNAVPHTIIGVTRPEFRWPRDPLVWAPFAWTQPERERHGWRFLQVFGRLAPGATPASAAAELNGLFARLRNEFPDSNTGWSVRVAPMLEWLVGRNRTPVLVLAGAVALVLLIACANVVNLMLARAEARHRELALRAALGAGRSRLVRHFLTESLLIAAVGGALGVFAAYGGLQVLLAMFSDAVPRTDQIGISGVVLGFAVAASLLTGIAVGVVPAWQASRQGFHGVLKEGGRSIGEGHGRLRRSLVVAQIALALMLFAGAGVLAKSFWRLHQVDLGLEDRGLLTVRLVLPQASYPDSAAVDAFHRRLLDQARGIPGVRQASIINRVPFLPGNNNVTWVREVGEADSTSFVEQRYVAPELFETLGIPILRGRTFTEADGRGRTPVVVVNQELVRLLFQDDDPIGRRLNPGYGEFEIVGVVGDIRESGPDREPRPTMYWSIYQGSWHPGVTYVLRTAGDPLLLAPTVRQVVRGLDPDLPLYSVTALRGLVAETIGDRRFAVSLLGLFAGMALLLSAVGIFGVMSYTVERRTREVGVRLALGAKAGKVLALVLKEAGQLAAVGIGLGLVGAFLLRRVIAGLLYEVSAIDPPTLIAVAAVLGSVALLACYLPARRAARVDPMEALRYE